MSLSQSIQYAKKLDDQDPLSHFREEFYLQPNNIYMDGNSLGLLSKKAESSLLQSLNDWKVNGIDGWTEGNEPWFYMAEKIGSMTSSLIGARSEETITTGSITTNLHQMLSTFYKPEGRKTKILADSLTFPSDVYAIKSQLSLHGLSPDLHLIQVKSDDGRTIKEADIIDAMNDEVALILLPSVLYRSGQLLDMKAITKAAHDKNILIGFDLAHSIGVVPHELHDWGIDFAVWCTYKYLNSGPGGVGGLFVHDKHLGKRPGLAGWFSSKKEVQFDMSHDLDHATSASAYQIGTPHIFSMAPLIGSLELLQQAGIDAIRRKSLTLTRYLMDLTKETLQPFGFSIANPTEDRQRGGHICLEHSEAARICKALKANGVVPDFRSPNVIRLAPIALYSSYEDVWNVIQILQDIMSNQKYKDYSNERNVIA
ncbi:kynureninase [Guptibacillus hwajinpoensis]|uniref:Kynureninase n=1 Tax=Guptibacillus hwajinpoensis TaxID=208199 RepID=A0ABU0JYA9_9BACL|nr:kynureninase [Alkalihalobacillus hemicentroti]MDQ0482039.1 kynureninase [Alkalihalobacillus hemicentroti]